MLNASKNHIERPIFLYELTAHMQKVFFPEFQTEDELLPFLRRADFYILIRKYALENVHIVKPGCSKVKLKK